MDLAPLLERAEAVKARVLGFATVTLVLEKAAPSRHTACGDPVELPESGTAAMYSSALLYRPGVMRCFVPKCVFIFSSETSDKRGCDAMRWKTGMCRIPRASSPVKWCPSSLPLLPSLAAARSS